jgi:hypothetical protein
VPKDIIPPNVLQERPIENFWGLLAHKVYEGGWEAKTEQQLIRRINPTDTIVNKFIHLIS